MQTRIRITYEKKDAMRFTGHLDFQQVWERALRRSKLPIAYSQGFHPQARLHLACALPLGLSSRCEIMDFWLIEPVALEVVTDAIHQSVPPGINILEVNEVDLKAPPLQILVRSSHYSVIFLDPVDAVKLGNCINDLMAATEIKRHKNNKEYNLRPLVESLILLPVDENGCQRLAMHLTAREGATGRPEEVLSVLGVNLSDTRIERTSLVLAEK
jgi:radical SAM-linked protein